MTPNNPFVLIKRRFDGINANTDFIDNFVF